MSHLSAHKFRHLEEAWYEHPESSELDDGHRPGRAAPSVLGSLTTKDALTDLYSLPSSDFHDITTGSNGYIANAGYDLVTGLGTPKADFRVDYEQLHGRAGAPQSDERTTSCRA